MRGWKVLIEILTFLASWSKGIDIFSVLSQLIHGLFQTSASFLGFSLVQKSYYVTFTHERRDWWFLWVISYDGVTSHMIHMIWTISYGSYYTILYGMNHIIYSSHFVSRNSYYRNPIFAVSRFLTINTRAATASRLEPKIINCWSFAGSNAVLCLLSVPLPSLVSLRSSTCSL